MSSLKWLVACGLMLGAWSLRLFHLETVGQLRAAQAVNKLFTLPDVSRTQVLLIIQKIV
jgi:hypothetical protein